jgi:hypothetical protein
MNLEKDPKFSLQKLSKKQKKNELMSPHSELFLPVCPESQPPHPKPPRKCKPGLLLTSFFSDLRNSICSPASYVY